MKRLSVFLILVAVGCARGQKQGPGLSEMSDDQAEAAVEGQTPPDEGEDRKVPPPSQAQGEAEEAGEAQGGQTKMSAGAEYKPLGTALQTGDEQLLVREASKFLAKNSKDLITLNAMAMHYFNRRKPELAKLILAKALALYPRSATVHNNLGLVYLKEGKQTEAISAFKRAQEIDANHPESAANLGSLLVKTKNYSAAVAYMQKAYRYMDKDPVIANNFAIALMGVKKYEDAARVLDGAKASESNNPTLLLNYAILLVEHLKDKKGGLKIVNKIRFLSQDEGILNKAQRLAEKAEALK